MASPVLRRIECQIASNEFLGRRVESQRAARVGTIRHPPTQGRPLPSGLWQSELRSIEAARLTTEGLRSRAERRATTHRERHLCFTKCADVPSQPIFLQRLLETASDENDNRCQMRERFVVSYLAIMSHQKAPEVPEPSKESLYLPSPLVTAQFSAVLSEHLPILPMRNNHIHAKLS